MKCPKCQSENRDDAKFCKACGFKLADLPKQPAASSACPNCGAALKPGAKFCSGCGSPVAAPAPAPVPAPDVKTEILSAPEPEATAETVIAAQPETAVESEVYAETETAAVDEAYAETEAAAEDEAYAETETAMEDEVYAETETAAENEVYAETETAAEGESHAETETAAEDEIYTETEIAPKPETVPEPAVKTAVTAEAATQTAPVSESAPNTAMETAAAAEAATQTAPVSEPAPNTAMKTASAAEPAASVCPNCGAALKPGAKFCPKCGTPTAEKKAVPKPEPVPVRETEPVPATYCKNCGTPLKPGAKFCPKCGTTAGGAEPSRTSEPYSKERPADTDIQQKKKEKKKHPGLVILLVILLLLGGGFFALVKTGVIDLPAGSSAENDRNGEEDENPENETKGDDPEDEAEEETAEDDEDISAELEEKLAPVNEQASAGEEKLNSEDYGGAAGDLAEALTAYADIASEYDSQTATDTISPLADSAFALYTTSILKQVEGWESQSVTAPLYQQIDATLKSAADLAAQLKESNLAITTDELDQNYAEFPARYKEKYILTFNDLRTGDEWSRTTAWQYMQDAASVGLVNKDDPDDPLTLRYSYALAWITQRDISEGMKDGSVTTESAISSILSLAESIDYNPVLMRDLALYYDATGDSNRSTILQNACADVYNHLANKENIYINAEELFVPGRSSSNASSTIALNDFWYFNDFGEYSPSTTNGVSPEGRKYIRDRYKEAINSL